MGTKTTSEADSRRHGDSGVPPARQNKLLAALPDGELRRLLSGAEAVSLDFGQVLQQPGEVRHQVYFPIDTYVSQIASLSGVPRIEVGLVGAEGMIGASLCLGVAIAPFHAVVQGAGNALRLDSTRSSA